MAVAVVVIVIVIQHLVFRLFHLNSQIMYFLNPTVLLIIILFVYINICIVLRYSNKAFYLKLQGWENNSSFQKKSTYIRKISKNGRFPLAKREAFGYNNTVKKRNGESRYGGSPSDEKDG